MTCVYRITKLSYKIDTLLVRRKEFKTLFSWEPISTCSSLQTFSRVRNTLMI